MKHIANLKAMSLRHFATGAVALACVAGWLAPAARADLVWTPEGGWHVEGGVLSPFFQNTGEASSALEAMNKAKTAQEAGNYWSALTMYDRVIADYPSSVFAPEALYQEGLVYIQRHQYDAANDAFERILKKYPDYPNFNGVIRQQYQIAQDLQSGKRPYIMWGFLPWFRDYQSANKYYNGIVSNAPYSEFAPLSLMNISIVAKNKTDEPDVAIDALDRLINNYPQSMLAPNAYLDIGDLYSSLVEGAPYDQGSTRQAMRYYQDYLFLYKSSPDAPRAEDDLNKMRDVYARSQVIIGDFYYNYRNNRRAALIFYNQAITLEPNSQAATEARAQIEKIQRNIPPPMTPYDVVFGRYMEQAPDSFEEQGQIDKLANQAFQDHSISEFVEAPGSETVETIGSNGQVEQYEGMGAADGSAVPGAPNGGFLAPVAQPQAPGPAPVDPGTTPLFR